MKKAIALLLTGALTAGFAFSTAVWAESVDTAGTEMVSEEESFVFAEWNEGAPSLEALVEFVEDVTNEASPNFVPKEDRIAVFDMDGTVYGELAPIYMEWWMFAYRVLDDPSFEGDAEMTAVAEAVKKAAADRSIPEGLEVQEALQQTRAFADMTLDEYKDYVTDFLLHDVWGFEGMTYAEAFYPPMVEVVDYLRANDFIVYLVSGSDRFACRTLIEGILDIPEENVIGMDVRLEAENQNGTDGLDYVLEPDEQIIRTDELLIKNVKMNKVVQIAKEIGRQPVLSFGNSNGDTSMAMYVTHDNKYRSEAFMLVADDPDRDWADPEKAAPLREKWESLGWTVISMKDDFRNIYPEGVVRMEEMPVIEGFETEAPLQAEETPAQSEDASPEPAPVTDAQTAPEEVPQADATPEPAPETSEETVAADDAAAEPEPEPAPADEAAATETAPAEAVPAEEVVQQEPGQTGSDEYTVAEGDNLWQIALKTTGNGNMYLAIADANGLEEPYELTIGQKLIIPEVVPVG